MFGRDAVEGYPARVSDGAAALPTRVSASRSKMTHRRWPGHTWTAHQHQAPMRAATRSAPGLASERGCGEGQRGTRSHQGSQAERGVRRLLMPSPDCIGPAVVFVAYALGPK